MYLHIAKRFCVLLLKCKEFEIGKNNKNNSTMMSAILKKTTTTTIWIISDKKQVNLTRKTKILKTTTKLCVSIYPIVTQI